MTRGLGIAIVFACSATVASAEPADPMPAEAPADGPVTHPDDTMAKPADKPKPATKSSSASAKPAKPKPTTAKPKPKPKTTKTAKKATSTTKSTAKSRKTTSRTPRAGHRDEAQITATTSSKAEEPTDPSRFDKVADPSQTPAVRYGSLSTAECYAELAHRSIAFTRESAPGVDAGVRLKGPLHGVTFKTSLPEAQRATSPWEIGDCRLILALDDFAEILGRYDIVEVRHYSMYRKPGESARLTPGKRHNGAVAIDAAKFIDKDGLVLDVDKQFNGAIGDKTCGDGAAPHPVTPEATKLRSILCDAVAAHLFNVVLTPNYNPPHHNHFHLEVTRGVTWFLVH